MSSHRKSMYLHKQTEWKELYESGESFRSIAEKEGIYYRTVQGVLRGVVEPRPKKAYTHLVDKWIEDYEIKGMHAQEIADVYGVDGVTVAKYLRNAGIEIRNSRNRKSPFEDVIPEWIERYKAGETLLEIADAYGTYPQTVHKHIHKKVTMRHYAKTSQIHDIERPDYFNQIDSFEKAYWLGIWFGTGFIATTPLSRECTLVTGVDQRETVDRFQAVIGYTRPIQVVKTRRSEVARLRIHNKQFAESLEKHGLIPDKENELLFPSHLDSIYLPSFLLGYIEGKGSAYIHKQVVKDVHYYQLWLYIYGSKSFLTSVQETIKQEANATTQIKEVKKRGKEGGSRYEMRVSRFSEVEKIIEWLYQDVTVFNEKRDMREKLEFRRAHIK